MSEDAFLIDPGPKLKRCPRCKERKTHDNFYACAGRGDGLTTYCKPCWDSYQRRRRDVCHQRIESAIDGDEPPHKPPL